ncbi:hypothetical protein M9H77_06497 [Catharanthus roseus]|uniref:Uncharacterized protein n=1 Tax=Catharanthus roseus TaxID=4058 RepID=A0ACC0BS98_CATRO|nr:hypothetical protein M9H77_06497 [Catharanthus roseus]
MPIRFQEIEEEEYHHHHHQHNRRHAEEEEHRVRPQTSPSRTTAPRPKTTTESNTRKLLCIFFKCIIMGFVLSLFLLFIGFAALILLHFLLATTAGRRRRRHRHHQYPQFSADPTTPISYSREDLQEFLPNLRYASSAQIARDCAICLENFKEGDLCRKLPDCRHLFHVNCVDTWLTKVPNCPICRTRVRLDSGSSRSMSSDDEWKAWWPVAFEDSNVAV